MEEEILLSIINYSFFSRPTKYMYTFYGNVGHVFCLRAILYIET